MNNGRRDVAEKFLAKWDVNLEGLILHAPEIGPNECLAIAGSIVEGVANEQWVYPRKGPKRDIGFEANGRRLGRCRHTDFQDQTSRCCEINERVQRELAELAS